MRILHPASHLQRMAFFHLPVQNRRLLRRIRQCKLHICTSESTLSPPLQIAAFFVLIALYHIKSDGLNPLRWRFSASMQIERPPPIVVVSSRRRGVLILPDRKRLVTLDNARAFIDWVWVWVK